MAGAPLPETCCPATVWIGLGQAAYLGPSLRLDPHSGSVDCVVVGIDEPFTLRMDGTELRTRRAVVPARTRHQVVAEGRVLFRYRDPLRPGRPAEMDERIRTALRIMRTRPEDRLSAAEVARAVHLSASRFLHLFSVNTGTTFRRYRLWARMMRVAAGISAGQDLTRASVDAGFASPAHFSDSFHDMFGLSAAKLLAADTRIVVAD